VTNRAPLIGVLVAVLIAVLFWFLLYTPRNDDLEAVRAETATLETRRSSLQNEVARLREVQANEVQIRAALARLEEFVPSGTAQATAVRQFQLAADAAGVEILTLAFAEPAVVEEAPPTGTPGTSLARIAVNMTVEGGYFQVVDFFRRIEVETPRAVLMTNANVAEGDDGFPSLTTSWSGDLFAIVPTPAEGGGAPAAPQPPPAEEGEGTEDATDGAPAEGETEPTEETTP
jgi:Tfp pilus assembly protein PilO